MAVIFHGILLFSSLFSIATAQSRLTIIYLNSTLSPTTNPTSWFSPSGHFAIGFYPQGTGFAVGVWLVGASGERVIVWTANRDDSPVSANSSLLLRFNGGLVLRSDGSDKTISDTAESASFASMLDSGNFVLYNSDSEIIWRTFDSPTDTILGGQRLSAGKALISSRSETNQTSGRFHMVMQTDGNLVFYPTQRPTGPEDAYWASGTNGRGDNVTLNLDDNGFMYLLNSTGSYIFNLTQGFDARIQSTTTNVYRATLGVDGVFRLYLYRFEKDGSSTQLMIWSLTSHTCEVKGLCGLNSYCVLNDIQPNCRCPPGFEFVDPRQQSLGCDRSFTAEGCIPKKEDVKNDMFNMSNIVWKDDPYAISPSVSEEGCREECLQDCRCVAAMFKDQNCYKQKLPLQYLRINLDDSTMAFVKVSTRTGDPGGGKSTKKYRTIGAITGVGILILTCCFVFILCLVRKLPSDNSIFFWKKKTRDSRNVEVFLENYGSLVPKRYRYSELKRVTKSFKEKLGQGGYGSVFKGKLSDDRPVAVKVLNNSKGGNGDEFINEVASIGRTYHVNVVTLLGFCSEGSKRALVYEFMSKGSLEKFIFSNKVGGRHILDCQRLFQIAVGIARGLEYLHRGCSTRIVHFDIKPHNILLDDDFCPKISDFGLAKLCPQQQSTLSMLDARGTIGYTAPEVFCRNIGGVSHKSDVYSFGMMVLEMIGGRKNIDAKVEKTSEIYFPHWVYKHIELKESLGFLGFCTEAEEDIGRKMVLVGLWCIQTDPTNRPSMTKVVEMLEGSLGSLEMPPKPYLSSPSRSCSSTT